MGSETNAGGLRPCLECLSYCALTYRLTVFPPARLAAWLCKSHINCELGESIQYPHSPLNLTPLPPLHEWKRGSFVPVIVYLMIYVTFMSNIQSHIHSLHNPLLIPQPHYNLKNKSTTPKSQRATQCPMHEARTSFQSTKSKPHRGDTPTN